MRRAVLLAVSVFALWAAPARADEVTASAGAVQATFSFTKLPQDGGYRDLHLKVVRGGRTAIDAPLRFQRCSEPQCGPAAFGGQKPVRVMDLDGDGEPEVLVEVYWGGAHCCFLSRVLRWTGSAYAGKVRNWGDAGFSPADLDGDGRPELTTADARFDYEFTAYAFAGNPIRIVRWTRGNWSDVTRRHPKQVRRDAALWWRDYRRHRDSHMALGVLAAWVADEYTLGRRARADARLRHELHAGRLKTSFPWPWKRKFIRVLKRRLRAWGYA